MNKKQALEVFQKHMDFVNLMQDKPCVDVSKESDPFTASFHIWHNNKQEQELYDEFCKENGKIEFSYHEEGGGEGDGQYTHVVHKIMHPSLGEAYLYYQGDYDSWNGTEWGYYNNPSLVEPRKRVVEITEWASL